MIAQPLVDRIDYIGLRPDVVVIDSFADDQGGVGFSGGLFPDRSHLKYTYVPQSDVPKVEYLQGPFINFGVAGNAYVAIVPNLDSVADYPDDPQRSPIVLLENGKPIGPAHTEHAEIVRACHGLYLHRRGLGIVFPASDNCLQLEALFDRRAVTQIW